MGCFLIPKKTCDEIDKLIRRFWWGGTDEKRKTHWVAWEKLQKPKEDGGLGFRDLRDFNVALLAKQSWRFIRNPESLVCRVYKAKYFRDKSLLDVVLGPSAQVSYAFRSIVAGIELLRSGMAWEVGSGHGIRVFADRWVPRTGSYGLLTPCPPGLESMIVAELMCTGCRQWDIVKLQQLFLPADVAAIAHVPIREEPFIDRRYWIFNEDGNYSVSTGYRAQVIRSKGESSSSAGHINRPLLKKLWKLRVPKKCIFPIWRLWHGSLALGAKFRERGMQVDPSCSHCEGLLETEEHLFINCPFAKNVWSEVNNLQFVASWNKTFKDLLIHILSDCTTSICELFVMTVWGIWRGRNELRFENKQRSELEVRQLGSDMLLWFCEARGVYGSAISEEAATGHWTLPPGGVYKINCDASFPNSSRVMGLGTCIRDSLGNFTAGKFSRRPKTRSVLLAELQALWMGMQLAADLHLQQVSIQSDSLVAINLLRDGHSGRFRASEALAEMDVILQQCKILARRFTSISFSYVSRLGNNLAHLFAQRGLVEDDMSFYFETPVWAIDVLSDDLLGSATQV